MRILFLIFHGFDPNNGISKKISYQIEAFRSLGHEIHICHMDEAETKRRIADEAIIADYGNGIISKIKKRIEFSSIVNFAKCKNIDFVYIRSNHNANPFTINMVKKMKEYGMKIVLEIPTFPYDSEYSNWHLKRQLIPDILFRKQFANNIDAIVTFSNNDFIFGQRTIKISNGIDFENVRLKKTKTRNTSEELNLIGVAEIHGWHGFDRVVKGLAEYYSKPQDYIVRFHIIGYFYSKEEEEEIRQIIHDCHMEEYVILYGKKHGKDLDSIFDECDFGIGSLGRHRVGIQSIKTLKNREYAARGIPFTYSENDSDFDGKPYVLKMPANDMPIDINSIISFYKQLDTSPNEIRDSIKNLSWRQQMKRVIEDTFPKERNKTTIRLAYCIPSLDRASGMERVLTIKANYLADILGYDVNIIVTDNKEAQPFFPLSNKVNVIQLDVNIDNLWQYPIWKKLYLYLKKEKEYRRKLERTLMWLQPDITISLLRREINFINDFKDGSIKFGEIHFGRYKYREVNFKYLPKCINKWMSSLWMKQLESKVSKLDRFVVLTHEDANQWKGINNIRVIPNPITINTDRRTLCNNKQVIAVGRYTYQKGFDLLIEAWSIVQKNHPDWNLHIYGAGDQSSYVKLASEMQITSSISFHGATENITEKYLDSSIFVLSSRFEGFGLVLAEAMSVGLPCVSFACPCGPRDIIKDGEDGILCKNGDIVSLADAICKLISDTNLRHNMSQKAYNNIQRYTIENIMTLWHQLFTESVQTNH